MYKIKSDDLDLIFQIYLFFFQGFKGVETCQMDFGKVNNSSMVRGRISRGSTSKWTQDKFTDMKWDIRIETREFMKQYSVNRGKMSMKIVTCL